MSKFAEDFRDDAKKLMIAGFYDHGLTLTMLKIFLEARGDEHCAESFRYKIYQWIKHIEEAMLTIQFMEMDDQDATLCAEGGAHLLSDYRSGGVLLPQSVEQGGMDAGKECCTIQVWS